MKYIKTGDYNSIVIFPCIMEHSDFMDLKPKTAGFCYISEDEVMCFGESYSLGLKSEPEEDSREATKQYCGILKMIDKL